jgi:hydrogenase maturation protease
MVRSSTGLPAEAEDVRSLVVGFGHRDRGDDGVAYHVVAALRRSLGQEPPADDDEGLLLSEGQLDELLLPQLAPEWIEAARGYERLVFVDAHALFDRKDLDCRPVEAEYTSAAFTHHMTVATFLALLGALYGERPQAWLVSIRGRAFDFGRELSAESAAQVGPAVEKILALTMGSGPE